MLRLTLFCANKLISNNFQLQALRHQLFTVYLPKIQLQDFYQCNIEAYVTKFGEEVILCGIQVFQN
jgi:hypothetical protein